MLLTVKILIVYKYTLYVLFVNVILSLALVMPWLGLVKSAVPNRISNSLLWSFYLLVDSNSG